MKPGDLLRPRKWNVTHAVPINYLDVWDKPDGSEVRQEKWEHGEIGLLLAGSHYMNTENLALVEVLLRGEKWWAFEDEIEVVK